MPMCAASRAANIILHEKGITFHSVNEPIWKRRLDFLKLNPEGELPVIDKQETKIIGYFSLAYFLDDGCTEKNLIGNCPLERLEVREYVNGLTINLIKKLLKI